MTKLKIIIVGAGIGGPAAAIGLARNGHDVTIYERSPTTSEVGYAFRITPNSDRCLKYLGIDTVAGGACAANIVRRYDATGNVLNEFGENQDAEKTKKGTSVFAYRPQLNQQLMDAVAESGVKVKTGVKVRSVDIENTSLVLEDGEKISADLIIAADGVHSIVRPQVVDSTRFSPSATTGHNALRFMLSKSLAQNDTVLSSIVDENARMFTWAGNDKRILVYPVDFGKQFNVTCTHPEQLSDKEALNEDSAAAIVSLDTVLSIYSEFGPIANRLFDLADPEGFRVWKLLDMDEIPNWSLNRTILLGDACHPVSPFGFSGASMAIEDAVALATLLTSDVKVEGIPKRLKVYEELRKPRVEGVRQTAREIARGKEDPGFMMNYMKFLGSYDAVEEAKKALTKSLDGRS